MTNAELAAIEAAYRAASPGPWGWGYNDDTNIIVLPHHDTDGPHGVAPVPIAGHEITASPFYASGWTEDGTWDGPPPLGSGQQCDNARFIVVARNAMPDLIATIRAERAALRELRAAARALTKYDGEHDPGCPLSWPTYPAHAVCICGYEGAVIALAALVGRGHDA